jgi:hypothetical protein
METEVSWPRAKELATDSYPEPNEFSSRLSILSVRTVLILSDNLLLGLPSGIVPSGFSRGSPLCNYLGSLCATYSPHPVILDFITLIVFGGEYKSWRCSLYNFFQPPVTLLAPNILPSALFSNSQSMFFRQCETRFHAHTKEQEKF